MRLLVYSDLHLEFSNFKASKQEYDAVVLAGDIHVGEKGIAWAKDAFPDNIPVIYICGNHEYYNHEVEDVQEKIRSETEGTNICYCENESVHLGDTRFLCATLWTDFRLTNDLVKSKLRAKFSMNDYRVIRMGDRTLLPDDTESFHWQTRRYFESELSDTDWQDKKTVVVTHHAPSGRSMDPDRYSFDLTPAYCSNLDSLVKKSEIDLWIHGHLHQSVDYSIGNTRVFANPRGYSRFANNSQNPDFQSDCIINV